MAEAIILSPLVQAILENLSSLIKEQISIVSGVEKHLKKLSRTLLIIKGVLRDAEEKQVKDESVRNWLRVLKDAAYEADDILDEWATEALRWKMQGTARSHGGKVGNLLLSCFCFNKVVFLHGIGNKIKEIRERLEEIAKERSDYDLKLGVSEMRVEIRETGSFVNESKILGRDDDRKKIVDLLLSTECGLEDLSIIPIVGIGGLGKTTLAQYVYKDERVQGHFELRMWVCVSEDFDVRKLIIAIMKSAIGESGESLDLDQLQFRLHQTLSGKRFLLVLDDIWNEDHEKWERLRDLLSSGSRGSTILVTTHSEKVSSIMGTVSALHLKGLSEDDCWSLFVRRVLGEGDRELDPNLIPIGKQIVKKCKGVPLAAKTLGSLMHFKRDETEWLYVSKSEIWNLPEEENGILNSLRLSYNHLPSHLKQCFVYCSIFPKDYKIVKNELIQLWIAEGFIQPSKGSKEMEDIALEYFNDLMWRSFFQDVKEDHYGVRFQMHDLIHDLALSIARDDCSIIEVGKSEIISKKVRNLSLIHDPKVTLTIPDALYASKNLRTFLRLFADRKCFMEVSNSLFLNLTCLRVLDLSYSNIMVLPDSIGNLKHLRYLNLSGVRIKTLPKSICDLLNLQTLLLRWCHNFSEFPKDMKNMMNLRHIEITHFRLIKCMPVGIGKLIFLHTLPLFIVGKENGCGIGELHDLNLRGKIEIKNLENIGDMNEAKEAKLKSKQLLNSLKLSWSDVDDIDEEFEEGILQSLQPHKNLRELCIEHYKGTKFPTWMTDSSLTKLVRISLLHCRNCNHLPPLGQLPFLRELTIIEMFEIKYMSDGFYGQGNVIGFPSLEILRLKDMPNLEEWSRDGEGELHHLLKLSIVGCPNLSSLPRLPSLRELELFECELPMSTLLPQLTTLSSLTISGFNDLSPFQEGLRHFTALKSLKIIDCDELMTLEHLTELVELSIKNCPNLTSLPSVLLNPTTFRHLQVCSCPKLIYISEAMQNLTVLHSLRISRCPILKLPERMQQVEGLVLDDCPNLTSLLEMGQHLTALKTLWIRCCPDLFSLPECFGNLSSLRRLNIEQCLNLGCLPEGLQHLTNLHIYKCHLLEENCRRGGKDWHKIAHIPCITISYV